MDMIKNILAVSWLTPSCSKTIQLGISLSGKYQAHLSVVHVMDTTWLNGWSIPMVSMEEEYKREMEKNKEALHHIISIENKLNRIIKEFVRKGTPSEVILKLIEEENIDLLILRSQEESRIERLLVGSSNDDIIRTMPCSIVLVKQEHCTLDEDHEINNKQTEDGDINVALKQHINKYGGKVMAKNIAVYGIYRTREMVEHAVEELKKADFRNTDISVLFPEGSGTKDFAVEKETKAPEGAATGAGTGAVVGGALGWLMGIGLLAIPGVGPFIAAGPIMAALAGAGAGGLAGGIAGALIGMGIPEYEANRYEGRIKEGGILLSVHADDNAWKNKGKDILKHTGAEDIGVKGESSADYDISDRPYVKGSKDALKTDGEPVTHRIIVPVDSSSKSTR